MIYPEPCSICIRVTIDLLSPEGFCVLGLDAGNDDSFPSNEMANVLP